MEQGWEARVAWSWGVGVVIVAGFLGTGGARHAEAGTAARVALAFAPAEGLRATAVGGTVLIAGRVRVAVEIVRTEADRARGLGGRPGLAPEHGMLFLFEAPGRPAIWMKDMRFSIDILWIRRGRVVDIKRAAPVPAPGVPLEIYTPRAEADLVLEVPAGFSDAKGIRIGDTVEVQLR